MKKVQADFKVTRLWWNRFPRLIGSAIVAASAALIALHSPEAAAQAFPDRPVKMIVAYPPGGGADLLARPIAQKLSERWGQPVIIENRAGANGTIGTRAGAAAEPDGHTLVFGTVGTHAINQNLYKNAGYDAVRDFAAVTMVANHGNLLVIHPSVPAKTLAEFIAYAKSNPGKLNYGSAGTGSPPHLTTELFKSITDVDMVHVPYKGIAEAVNELIGGRTHMIIASMSVLLPHIKSGRLRPLATTNKSRLALAPDIPTLGELGMSRFEASSSSWVGIFAPAKTPKPVIDRINADVLDILKTPEIRQAFGVQGAEIVVQGSEEFSRTVKNDVESWRKTIIDLNIKSE